MIEKINEIVKKEIGNDNRLESFWCRGEQFQINDSSINLILILTRTKSEKSVKLNVK